MDEKFNLDNIDKTFTRFKVGAQVSAVCVEKLKDGILLNIGGKKDGLIPYSDEENEAIKDVKVGDSFDAIIVKTKDESDAIILSKAKADFIKWGNKVVNGLKVGDSTNVIISSTNKAGLIAYIGQFEVFIPFSQISNRRVDNNLENYVNKQVSVVILEIDLSKRKIVASKKAFEENERITTENAFWESIFENKIVTGKIVRFTDFGAFVNVNGVDCLVHNIESSYDRDKKASDIFEIDKEYEFKVIKCDKENKRASLSYKALQENPLNAKVKEYKVGDVVEGEVKKILPFGAIIKIKDEVEGLLHIKEASHFYVKNIYEVAKVGQMLKLKIINIDYDNNKISLSLKALQEEPDVVKLSKTIE